MDNEIARALALSVADQLERYAVQIREDPASLLLFVDVYDYSMHQSDADTEAHFISESDSFVRDGVSVRMDIDEAYAAVVEAAVARRSA